MPRRKRTQLDHRFIYGRWKVFGEWLTMQRNNRGLTQREAARAVKISRQQWMRYESGSKVLKKRMPAMAAANHCVAYFPFGVMVDVVVKP